MARSKKNENRPQTERVSRDYVEHPPRGTVQYRDFDGFWFKVSREMQLRKEVKHQIWTYFKSIGILNEPSKYEEGLKSFGLGN